MYILTVRKSFDAAHLLKNYQGKCANLHGHTWSVEVGVRGDKLNSQGMLVDFRHLKSLVNDLIKRYDHVYLNEMPEFSEQNPTAENIAGTIFREMQGKLPSGVVVDYVRVWESPETSATYRERED
ncbi:MAG: 6-carboxytetrahydropterin synthase QueD [Thermoanaerobacteraceae bacterium]|nr:6-carboxytetrahydropterin synthase QueD [Thermoanaerobacteraceae bacterium]